MGWDSSDQEAATFKENVNRFAVNNEGPKVVPYHPLVWILGKPEIGEETYIGGFSEINAKRASVHIGRACDIASFVSINASDSHRRAIGLSEEIEAKPIFIGDQVFIGSHCFIGPGTTIGHNSVIGAGTILCGETVQLYSLVVGGSRRAVIRPGYYSIEAERLERTGHRSDGCGDGTSSGDESNTRRQFLEAQSKVDKSGRWELGSRGDPLLLRENPVSGQCMFANCKEPCARICGRCGRAMCNAHIGGTSRNPGCNYNCLLCGGD